MMYEIYETAKFGNDLLQEIHFWTINLKLMEIEVEKEEKNILLLQKRVINEIDRIQIERENNESKSKS